MPATMPTGQRFDVVPPVDVAVARYLTVAADAVAMEEGPVARRPVLPSRAKLTGGVTCTLTAGGSAANVAVACPWLGLRAELAAHVGDDRPSREAVATLQTEGIDIAIVRFDPTVPTSRNGALRGGHERTILGHHELHDYGWPHLQPAEVRSWLFLSSVGRSSHRCMSQIVDCLEAMPEVRLAFEPGTFQVPAVLLDRIFALGPKRVVITDGSAGAHGRHDRDAGRPVVRVPGRTARRRDPRGAPGRKAGRRSRARTYGVSLATPLKGEWMG